MKEGKFGEKRILFFIVQVWSGFNVELDYIGGRGVVGEEGVGLVCEGVFMFLG